MSDLPRESGKSSSGGLAVILLVFFTFGFALAVGGSSILSRISTAKDDEFVLTPAVDLVQPEPRFAPDEVVALQIEGLENKNSSDGIQQCFVFASPNNKEVTGPLERFAAMVRTPPYDVLQRHHLVLIGQPALEGNTASVVVTLLDDNDQIRVFQFVLSKQSGEGFKDCWMTDAVYPVEQSMRQDSLENPAKDDSNKSAEFLPEGGNFRRERGLDG